MILYSVINLHQLLNAAVHKKTYHDDDECILAYGEWINHSFLKNSFIEENFQKIFFVNQQGLPINKIDKAISDFKKTFSGKYEISDFDEIYVGGSQYKVGICLNELKIPFNMFEDAAGTASTVERLHGLLSNYQPENADYCLREGLFDGTGENVKSCICQLNAQEEDLIHDKMVNFDVTEALLALPKEVQQSIIGIFTSLEEISVEKDSTLIMTEQLTGLKAATFEEQIIIYQSLLDYFIPTENTVFKTHPDDVMYYGSLFPKAKVIRERFPSEILPALFTECPRNIATVASTSVNNLKPFFEKCISLDTDFYKQFVYMPKLYTANAFAKKISNENANIDYIGINDKVMTALSDMMDIECAPKESLSEISKKIIFIDNISKTELKYEDIIEYTEKLDEDSVIIFPNTEKDFCFYHIDHKELWKNVIPIRISKVQNRADDYYMDNEADIIYIYTKNERLRTMAENFEMEKTLENTGATLDVKPLTEEERKIKILEGMLEATENRLRYYINIVENNSEDEK